MTLLPAVLAQATTTIVGPAPAPVGQDPDPLNAGGIVFLFVSLVIFGTALLLYLRHRPRARR